MPPIVDANSRALYYRNLLTITVNPQYELSHTNIITNIIRKKSVRTMLIPLGS